MPIKIELMNAGFKYLCALFLLFVGSCSVVLSETKKGHWKANEQVFPDGVREEENFFLDARKGSGCDSWNGGEILYLWEKSNVIMTNERAK